MSNNEGYLLDAEYAAAKTKLMESVQAERGDPDTTRDAVIEELFREKHAEEEAAASKEEEYQTQKAEREAAEARQQEEQGKKLLKIIEEAPMAL